MALPATHATVRATCLTRPSKHPRQSSNLGRGYPTNWKVYCRATRKLEVQSGRANKEQTLYGKLGGAPAVKAAVDIFYDRMLSDSRVNYFFEGVDMKKQRAHQTMFLSFAMGGAKSYGGNANMTAAHQRLAQQQGMRMEHFDIVLEHLTASLQDLNVPEANIQEVAATVEQLRPDFQMAIDIAVENDSGTSRHA